MKGRCGSIVVSRRISYRTSTTTPAWMSSRGVIWTKRGSTLGRILGASPSRRRRNCGYTNILWLIFVRRLGSISMCSRIRSRFAGASLKRRSELSLHMSEKSLKIRRIRKHGNYVFATFAAVSHRPDQHGKSTLFSYA